MRKSLEDERFLESESRIFDKSKTYEQYKSDIRRFLMLCSWKYSAEMAAEIVEMYENFVEEAYEKQEPVADIALAIGYGCG